MGKFKLPAPKNKENKANAVRSISFVVVLLYRLKISGEKIVDF